MGQWFNKPNDIPYCCVVGSPISHSRSPEIHHTFGRQCGVELYYDKVEVSEESFVKALAEFVALGGRGMNITVPLKEHAYRAVLERSERAATTGAVNTISVNADGKMIGDNTDGVGLVRDLMVNHALQLADSQILLLGAGGAARGVLPSLLAQSPAQVVVANRTVDRAFALVDRFGTLGTVVASSYADVPSNAYDLIINATSLGLAGQIPPVNPSNISVHTTCYDMMYTQSGRTDFLDWGRQHGAVTCLDGWGMLVEQAAQAFSIWFGVKPATESVIAELR